MPKMKLKVSRCMSTQHPDNVRQPFFASSKLISGEDEIKEAFYVFSHLKCREQLWDCEGKEVDSFVVKKLLTNYEPFFKQHELGRELFLTLRVPNPSVERNEAKVLLESLESVPRSFDAAKAFYNKNIAPVFEVAVPMVTTHKSLVRIAEYYKQIVVGKENKSLIRGDITIAKWIGSFNPKSIRIIPLIETKEAMLCCEKITAEFIKHQKPRDYQRVWLARSDPALNYSSLAAVLLEKVALQHFDALQDKTSVDILPIIGCGSAPFRGNFKPTNYQNCLKGYPSVHTFTIQSAFKYDYDEQSVVKAIEAVNSSKRKKPIQIDEAEALRIIEKVSKEYQRQVRLVSSLILKFSSFVPQRRKRKLHIGLFGYSRKTSGVQLPRAIKFCCALYSIGIPPDIFGLNLLDDKDIDFITSVYPHFWDDMADAVVFLNHDNIAHLPREVQLRLKKSLTILKNHGLDFRDILNNKHRKITSIIMEDFKRGRTELIQENIERAAWVRQFLG